ncbi:hypothetical protein BJX64DRAFT_287533 [Aspergillus heterothallicus]
MQTRCFLARWHRVLHLPRQPSLAWHRARIREELAERRHARNFLQRLSEMSDVLFSTSRARHDGFEIHPRLFVSVFACPSRFLRSTFGLGLAYAYMLTKFTLRWGFYRTAAYFAGSPKPFEVREVVNPRKKGKLDEVAERHQIDKERFRRICARLKWVWPLLP